jgi:hypothetical protein
VRVLLTTRADGLSDRIERSLLDRYRATLGSAREVMIGTFGGSDDHTRWFAEAIAAYAKAARTPPADLSSTVSGWSFDASEPILTRSPGGPARCSLAA